MAAISAPSSRRSRGLYLSWLILLLGAQLSFYVQHPEHLRTGHEDIPMTGALRERLAMSVMFLVGERFISGGARWSINELAERLDVPGTVLGEVLSALEAHELVLTAEDDTVATARDLKANPRQIADRLSDRFRLLAGGKMSRRHAALRAAIDASWELLRPWEQEAFAQGSVFEGAFTLEAAEEVLDLAAWPEAPWVVDVMLALVDKSRCLSGGDGQENDGKGGERWPDPVVLDKIVRMIEDSIRKKGRFYNARWDMRNNDGLRQERGSQGISRFAGCLWCKSMVYNQRPENRGAGV